ncbi:MAG: hypothetical protein RMK65_12435, partial [Anaerolineae bacterium]|nr:hypothetical protein [Anaerolineae bacterium]
MLVLPLRWLLFGLFLATVATVLLALWMDRRRTRRRAAETFADAALHAVLEHAPFGWMVLESPERYVYANEYARRLLELESSSGPVPAVEWGFLLDEQSRRRPAGTGPQRPLSCPSPSLPAGPSAGGHVQRQRWDYLFLWDIHLQYEAEEARAQLFASTPTNCGPLWALSSPIWKSSACPTSPGDQAPILASASDRTRRLARMVHLMLPNGPSGPPPEIDRRPVDLADLAERAISSLASQRRSGAFISPWRPSTLPTVWGDPDRLMQVFLNLLDNVLKH